MKNEKTKNKELLEEAVKQNSNKKQVEDKTFSIFKISELGYVVTGKTPSKDNPEDWGDLMPFVTPSDYKNYRKYAIGSERMLSQQGVTRLSSKVLPPKSVLVTCIGSDMGKVVMNNCEVITNQQINSIIPFNNIVDNNFLYYSLVNLYDTLRVYGGDGSAVPILNKSDFENIEIDIPPLPEQRAIAAVLSSLDDKIDLLHRQNKTLEAMAETLFRQWFIEPCKNGLPEGWEKGKLGDYVDCINGVSYKGSDLNTSDCALVTLKNFDPNGGFRLDGFKCYTGKYKEEQIVWNGDLAVAHTDITQDASIIGNPIYIIDDPKYKTLVISMDLVKVNPKHTWLSKEFLYLLMKTSDFKEHCLGLSNGSTVLHLSRRAVPSYAFKMPPRVVIEEFTKIVKGIFSKMNKNIVQIRNLEKLRDLLLPKLISGEIRVRYE
ncbi:MAG TPA: restriction endonuclease subunit S [Ignavibacteria bacterium]